VTEGKRVPGLEAWLRRRLLSEQCVALVPQSHYALRQFRWKNRNYSRLPALEAKTHVVYPAVAARATAPKRPSGKLRLLFVGRKFMRKGGPALLRAHERLRHYGLPVETTVVSALQWIPEDYVGPSSEDYVRKETERLAQAGVTHHTRLPNADVLRLMDEADFFVLPTLHETFGFVAIEALSAATPVIATGTCALPEVVEDKGCGYLLPLDNEPNVGKWTWISRRRDPEYLDAYDQAMDSLGASMAEKLITHWESGTDYEALSAGALDRVRSRFAKQIARDQYEALYELCRERGAAQGRRVVLGRRR
jgi:glycosyltransferase involved in cell wall biosynthesis